MSGRAVERFEMAVDMVAAVLFAAAVGFCIFSLLRLSAHSQAGVVGAAAFGIAFLLCRRALRAVTPTASRLILPRFEAVLDPIELDELLLTDADRLHSRDDELVLTDADRLQEPLILDDILAEIGPDSRVVRLFDPSAVPTPGQLKARIDQHLDEGAAAPEDASQALFEALAQLRRSLA